MFRTKPTEIREFRILAVSCDRPNRLLLGQKNPWFELARKAYNSDLVLHLGDQVMTVVLRLFTEKRFRFIILERTMTTRWRSLDPSTPSWGRRARRG